MQNDARLLLVAGAAQAAKLLPEADRTVRPVERVAAWARIEAQAQALAAPFVRNVCPKWTKYLHLQHGTHDIQQGQAKFRRAS